MRGRAIARQIELHGDALPARVGVRRDQVARNIAGEHRDRIHADLGVAGPNRRSSAGASRRMNASRTGGRAQRAADDVPHRALLRRQVADVFGKQVDLHPRVGAVGEIVALAAAVHRPVVGRLRHVGEHRRIDVVRETRGRARDDRTASRRPARRRPTPRRNRATARPQAGGCPPSVRPFGPSRRYPPRAPRGSRRIYRRSARADKRTASS